jgi:hypothetical protein
MTDKRLPLVEEDPKYLPPDEVDLYIVSHIIGLPCPFCKASGTHPRPKYNPDSRLFGYFLDCGGGISCMASVCSGGYHTRDEARDEALRRWNKREGTQHEVATSEKLRAIVAKRGIV